MEKEEKIIVGCIAVLIATIYFSILFGIKEIAIGSMLMLVAAFLVAQLIESLK
jgi:hypothetical protein